ncbi:Magnesium transporter mgtE [Oligella ureolytica]|uniref:magnesium transporter n=1 Tax=Oligella ureolytica TaxID=90244 RepID=UPI000E0016D7|nr:magnesium transporter [Oligella ureolytica]SUA58890.1 Magnesium transporter mgtE [Oligella ureolytica]
MKLDMIIELTQLTHKLTAQNKWETAFDLLKTLHFPDIANVLEQFPEEVAYKLLTLFEQKKRSHIFAYMHPDAASAIFHLMNRSEAVALFEGMDHDVRADFYNRLSEQERQDLLVGLTHEEREDIRKLASYAEKTVGAIMTSAYIALEDNLTVEQTLERIRADAADAEIIYQIYIIDQQGRLGGTLSLRQLLTAESSSLLRDIMVTDVVSVNIEEDQSKAAKLIARYDFLALPVLDHEQRLLGIVTHDDALDVSQEVNTEYQMRMGSVSTNYAKTTSLKGASIWLLYRMRVFWLVILVLGNVFSGAGIAYFEDLIESMVSLVFFLPLLIDSGGNAGSQSSTLMVRALATGDVRARDWMLMLGKELVVSLLLSLSMALAVSLIGFYRGGAEIALVVSLTMVVIVMVGSIIGMLLPFVLTRFKLDPASASAPLITSICDGVGVLIYFNIANILLDMPGV